MSNDTMTITVSAPASVMLMGEHAVVKGYKAIACALDKRIEVNLIPRKDRLINIDSAVAKYHGHLDELVINNELSFVLTAIALEKEQLEYGFDLVIRAQFAHTLGLGSSAAVTVATIKALALYSGQSINETQHLEKSLAVVHRVQKRGSGTDLAASIYGGVIAYQITTDSNTTAFKTIVERLPMLPEIALYYVGYKTTTAVVLAKVAEQENQFSELYANIYKMMGYITLNAIQACKQQSWRKLGQLMNMYQGQMDSLGVSDRALSDIIYRLRADHREIPEQSGDAVLGAKISGSGLGDCVISLGNTERELQDYQTIEITITSEGVKYSDQ
ncbi:galactokinase family protein [Gammaproteobacteria bacterium AS21]